MVLVINNRDNVGIALEDISSGMEVKAGGKSIIALDSIMFGHKLALTDIRKGESIIKYGEVIGVAVMDIKKGAHVHVHNIVGLRGRGDRTT